MKPLNFKQIIVKFFDPLTKHPFHTIIASIVIGITSYIGVDIVLAEVVRQNTYELHMLSAELLNELGPCYIGESGRHAEMIKQYTKHLEQRQLAALVRVLYPKYGTKKEFDSVLLSLEKAVKENDGEKAKEVIWQAGLSINKLYILSKKFPRSPIAWFDSEDLPSWLLTDLNKAFVDSNDVVNKLKNDQTREAAIEACIANRKTILLLFLGRLGYDNEEKIKSFLSDVKRSYEYTKDVAEKEENEKVKEEIFEIAISEEHRVKILESMLANDMDKVCDLLREAIERAYKKRGEKLPE